MDTKLTLMIENSVIEKAKLYAKVQSRSLSDIIENYLKVITKDDDKTISDVTPMVKSLRGSFTPPKDFEYKKELASILSEEYL